MTSPRPRAALSSPLLNLSLWLTACSGSHCWHGHCQLFELWSSPMAGMNNITSALSISRGLTIALKS